ncbi:AbrB/MazE/SpoVT family DNA-binding domain-containing protein [Aureimonas psammosilenae]|uniref:AbrB/MazE/SpoVT family DNA-binding domain-containing protein n=1 Tax=Aureimonas psammosilenae TaxID=2495496 RepID=UPI001260F9A6|nr:AbrB/MazE/SpoVT family DNA-binding domain-containing protein [Aureimonas psammosilenae]
MDHRHVVPVAANGRMNLPSSLRSRLELEGGGKVVFIEKENGEVEVTTLRRSLKRAQDLVRHYIPNGAGTVDEFIAERRAEAEREEETGTPSEKR